MSRNNIKSIVKTICKALIFALLFLLPYPARAYVLWQFWKWFIVPIGLARQISYANALALVITSALILVNVHKNQGEHMRPLPPDKSSALEDLFTVTMETTFRTGLIFVFGCAIRLWVIK